MKSRNSTWYVMLLTLAITVAACKKDKATPTDINTLLTYKKWKAGMEDLHPETNPKGSIIYYPWSECDLDNVYSYGKDQTYRANYGKKKCTEWSQDEVVSDYVLHLDSAATTIQYKDDLVEVFEISADQLKLGRVLRYYATGPEYLISIFHH